MKIINKKYIDDNREEIIQAIIAGKIFIYPTDTIYGIGANATNNESVRQIRTIKERETKPFSIIAPSKKWISDNLHLDQKAKQWVKKLPGPITLFLDRKNIDCVCEEVNGADDSLGVRMPKHWFSDLITKAKVPFITTSVNICGSPYMTKIEDVDSSILNSVDYVVYEGEKKGKESKKIDLRKN